VVPVAGGYTEAVTRSREHTRRHGGINRNTAYNPLTIEGKKTAAVEIAVQMSCAGVVDISGGAGPDNGGGAPFAVPDYVFVPTGDGVILSGLYKGFRDLTRLGFTNRVPVMVAVQAAGSAAIAHALERRRGGADRETLFQEYRAETAADSISVDVPAAGYYAVEQLMHHGGRTVVVNDDEILQAQHRLARLTGLFAEPAAAAALAGLERMRREIPEEATVVLVVTGSGLKDIDAAARLVDIRP
jgi:threonine synthase